jgi:adenine-specific DNA-methyltransferase
LDLALLRKYHAAITEEAGRHPEKGIIAELYAPQDGGNNRFDERVFYTARNAAYIDTVRRLISTLPAGEQKYFLAPLLSEASIHANTSGIFKGFYKNRETGIGKFGGIKGDALWRITGDIQLPFPVFSNFNCETLVCRGDSNKIIRDLPEVDIAYLDPPYNQHPYGSNYFMLNLIVDYEYPEKMSRVSGIPENWNRSDYNKENQAFRTLTELVRDIKSKFVLVSFNSDGFIRPDQMKDMLKMFGRLEVLETQYNTFRGSRNLRGREIHVIEYLYLLEKKT